MFLNLITVTIIKLTSQSWKEEQWQRRLDLRRQRCPLLQVDMSLNPMLSHFPVPLPVLQPPREWSRHGLEHDHGVILPQQGCAISRQHAAAVDQPAIRG